MPFPFMPLGALLALAVLSGALAVFGAALKALDWTIDAARGSMLSSVVSGIRNWDAAPRRSATGSPDAAEPSEALGPEVIEIGAEPTVALQRVSPSEDAPRGD
jgi:hypothetical protein